MQSIRNFNGMDGVIYCAIVKGCTPVQKRVPWMPKTNRSSLRDVLESIVQWRREGMKEGKIRNFLVDDDEKSINIFTYIRHCFISGWWHQWEMRRCKELLGASTHCCWCQWIKLECYSSLICSAKNTPKEIGIRKRIWISFFALFAISPKMQTDEIMLHIC